MKGHSLPTLCTSISANLRHHRSPKLELEFLSTQHSGHFVGTSNGTEYIFGLTGIFETSFEDGPLLTGLVGPNWQNWKLLSSVPFFCIQLTRTITKRAAAWVGSVQQECTVPYIWASGISEILYRNFCWMESPPACPWYKSRNHSREDETENLSKVSRLLFQSHCLLRLQKQSFLSPYKSSCFESYQDNIFELGIPVLSKGLS